MKRFAFEETSYSGSGIRHGRRMAPYYLTWQEVLGSECRSFSLDELERLTNLGDARLRRLRTMREGTKIKASTYHSTAYIALRRLTQDEINKEAAERDYRSQLKAVRAKIYACVPKALHDEERRLAKLVKGVTSDESDEDDD